QQAVESIRHSLRGPVASPDSIFRAINARLSRGDLTPAEVDNVQAIARMIDLHDYQQGAKLGDIIIPYSENGRIDFRVRLGEEVKSEPFNVVGTRGPDGPVYVLDNPGLHGNDPSTRIVRPIDTTLERELGKTVRLPRFDLAWAKPRVIETFDGRKWLRVEQLT